MIGSRRWPSTRLTALPDIYGAIAQAAAKRKDASYADFLEEVLRAERDARRVRAREMLTRTAGFPAQKTLDEVYDFAFATGAPRAQIQELASLGFVERAENVDRILLENYYLPGQLEHSIDEFVEYYNNCRYHESLDNLTPADVYFRRGPAILKRREAIKRKTIEQRRRLHQQAIAA